MEEIPKGKLVRDRIPEIIAREGREPVTLQLNGEQLLIALREKLKEEVAELLAAGDREAATEELADVYEVLEAFAERMGIAPDELAKLKDHKRAERGGFEEGIFLIG